MRTHVATCACSLAYQLKAFVISSCAIVTDELIDAYGPTEEDHEQLEKLKGLGGTCIVGPRGKVISGPMKPVKVSFIAISIPKT